jgi:hypothetical protein
MNEENLTYPNKKRLLCEVLAGSRGLDEGPVSINRLSSAIFQSVPTLSGIASLQTHFGQHLAALWNSFLSGYCKTKDYWPPGCSLLAFQNRALDLSLVSLSAQQLALSFPKSSFSLLSLKAYNESISIYRKLLQNRHRNSMTALLAVTSTMYALMEASLMKPLDITTFSWGKSGHFDAALSLLMQGGPDPFALPGFHFVFKKIREMGASLTLCELNIKSY